MKVVRRMFEIRFGEKPPDRRSVDQLRGIEGARVKKMYELLAKQYGVPWKADVMIPNSGRPVIFRISA